MRTMTALGIAVFIVGLTSAASGQIHVTSVPGDTVQFSSSAACAKCHRDIYKYWKDSLHAKALEDYIFQAAFMMALKVQGDQVRALCLGCHSPSTRVTGDIMLKQPISSEAITCDFCHRITSVSLENAGNKVTITTGAEKYGPLEPGTRTDSHPSAQSGLFEKSEFCAACHQWTNSHGIAIFDTYREWLDGPFPARHTHCQDCHMPLVEGSIVSDRPNEKTQQINSHNLAGGHSIEQVASAARVEIITVTEVPGGLQAIVEVSNVGSGHMIPTGIPSRELVLHVQLLDQKNLAVETREHVFKRIITDAQHNELLTDADIILNGALVSKDNRIPPGGSVRIPFNLAAAHGKRYLVRATLRYRYRPLVIKEEEIAIEMGTDSQRP
ncbi:MAG: multiheme c-type cytochrome [Candidatus Abyssubacteria bacterium]